MPNYVIKDDLDGIKAAAQAAISSGEVLSVTRQGEDIYVVVDEVLSSEDEEALAAAVVSVPKKVCVNVVCPETGTDLGEVARTI